MKSQLKFILGGALVAAFCAAAIAHANPLALSQIARSATATSTVIYMTPGTGTSTIVYDSYGVSGTNQTNIGSTYLGEGATLAVHFAGSSTAATLNVQLEYSNDNVDWYRDTYTRQATTSTTVTLDTSYSYSLKFASTTNGGVTGTTSPNNMGTSTRAIGLDTPARFIRAVFFIPAGSANGAVYSEIWPRKQVPAK